MIMTTSIRARLFRLLSLFVIVVSMLYAIVVVVVAYATEDQVMHNILRTETHFLRTQAERGVPVVPRHADMQLFLADETLPQRFRDILANASDDNEARDKQGNYWHFMQFTMPDGKTARLFLKANNLLAFSLISHNVLLLIVIFFSLIFALTVGLAYVLAKGLSQPLVALADACASEPPHIQDTEAFQRQDELGELARALQQSFADLQDALHRESDFTRDVGHELRTPLAVIKNYLTLRKQRALRNEEMHQLEYQVDKINLCVDALMALARSEELQARNIGLRGLVEEVLLSVDSDISLQNIHIDLHIDYRQTIQGHPALCHMLFLNLVNNALDYATQPTLRVTADERQCTFSNPAKTPPHDPFARQSKGDSSTGIGQGLYLVERIASVHGWRCSATYDEGWLHISLIFA